MAASTPEPASGQVQDEQVWLTFERLRWGGEPDTCPHCGAAGRCYLLAPTGGVSRRTRTGATTGRRVWKCGACRRQFSVLTGTVLHGTRVPLPAWLAAIELLAGGPGDVSVAAVRRATGLGPQAARHVITRWAAACEAEPLRSCVPA